MIDRFNMISMGGIDIVESQGVVVEGLYNKLLEGIANCRYQILYNWYFAKVVIPPTTVELVNDGDSISINGFISIDSNDVVHVYSLEHYPTINPISISQNGEYTAPEGVDGYSPVQVNVVPTINPISISQNGEYTAPEGVDGYSPIQVNVVPEYQKIAPDFYGLATAYQALNSAFYTTQDKTQCLFIAEVEAGANYVVFLPAQVGTRFRAAQWPGKTLDDFSPYLDSPGTNTQIYTGGQMITPTTELQDEGLTRRFFFTGVDGEVIIGTSNTSQLVEPILLKINN